VITFTIVLFGCPSSSVLVSRFSVSLLQQSSCFASLRNTPEIRSLFLLCHHSTESSSTHFSLSHLFLEPPILWKARQCTNNQSPLRFPGTPAAGRDYDAYGACSRSSIDFATRRIFYPRKCERCTKKLLLPHL
jgi:hypothetical protein